MKENSQTINFEYKEVKKASIFFKAISVLLILLFITTPLYDLIDVFGKEFYFGWCCMLPCPDPFSGYFFI